MLEVGGWETNNYKYSACLVIRVQLVVTWCPGSSAASLLVLTGHKTSHSFNSWPRHHLLPTLMRTWTNLSRLIKPMAALQSRRESVFGKCRPAAPVRRRLGCNYTSSEHSLQPVIESLNILCWLQHKWHYNMQKVTEHWAATINKYLQWICVGTPLPLHNKYIYKTTKDSLKLMIMGVLGGRIESHLVYQLDPRNATPGNLASDMTTQLIIIFFMKDLIS